MAWLELVLNNLTGHAEVRSCESSLTPEASALYSEIEIKSARRNVQNPRNLEAAIGHSRKTAHFAQGSILLPFIV